MCNINEQYDKDLLRAFNSMTDAEDYVREALQEFVREYDVPGIAHEMTDWIDGKLYMVVTSKEFWQIVMENER